MKDRSEKNPLFIPAVTAALFSAVNYVVLRLIGYGTLMDCLKVLEMIVPPIAVVLSIVALVTAIKHGEGIGNIGVCFSIISFIVSLFSMYAFAGLYLSGELHHCEPITVTRSLTPEESASIESINEEIERALKGGNTTRSAK